LKWALRLDETCRAAPTTEKTLEALSPSDVRRHIFLLEGILKLYAKRYEKPIEKQYESLKALEDHIGQYTLRQTILESGKKNNMPVEVIDVFEQKLATAKQELLDHLEENWRPDKKGRIPAIHDLVKALKKIDWDGYADDKVYVRGEMSRRMGKLADTSYDMHTLDEMHEFRRQLRWFSIYSEAVDGLIVLDDRRNPAAAYAPLLADPIATGPFAQLPSPARERSPIALSKSLYLANRQLSDALGLLKDAGEALELTTEALRELGRSKREAHSEALKLLGKSERDAVKIENDSKKLYDGAKKNRLVESLRDELI
jgi:hypothetical protein